MSDPCKGIMSTANFFEINFDGLVGPTHNYAGLSFGNVASVGNSGKVSYPKQAALQGLSKMKELFDMGLKQAVLPPHERPAVFFFRNLGYSGDDQKVLSDVYKTNPKLFISCCSASSMWAANSATVTPSLDTFDHKLHFTPANLNHKFHRLIEAEFTETVLTKIFSNSKYFKVHPPLKGGEMFSDEGAANHTRLAAEHGTKGIHFFVYGRSVFGGDSNIQPSKFPARQTYEASKAIARSHGIDDSQLVFAQQSPEAIDAGVFHNDVICVGNESFLFYHEKAFINSDQVILELKNKFDALESQRCFIPFCVKEKDVSMEDVVKSYLFNSQIITASSGEQFLAAPMECSENNIIRSFLDHWVGDSRFPIKKIKYFNLRESMQNGGGPACLRLRVQMSQSELNKIGGNVLLGNELYHSLCNWVKKHYRDELSPADLADPNLWREVQSALDELSQILQLGSIYSFQRV